MSSLMVMIKPVSSMCNMRCQYCFYEDESNNRQLASMGKMADDTLENLIRKAIRYADETVTFAFQGGEPTLAGIEFFQKAVEYQKSYNTKELQVQNVIQTNGYALSDEFLDFLKKEEFLVGISYDGLPEIHDKLRVDRNKRGTAERVEETIRRMQKRGIPFNILCVVNKYVAQEPRKVWNNLGHFGYIQYIACLDPFGNSEVYFSPTPELYAHFLKETFDLYYREYRKGKFISVRNFDNYIGILKGYPPENCGMCGRCARYYLVEADGGVYPCDFYVLDQWYMGNINRDSFFKLEKSEVGKKFREMSYPIHEKCRNCRWYALCRGGCRREREPYEDEHFALNKWCKSYQEFFEYSYERMKEMAGLL